MFVLANNHAVGTAITKQPTITNVTRATLVMVVSRVLSRNSASTTAFQPADDVRTSRYSSGIAATATLTTAAAIKSSGGRMEFTLRRYTINSYVRPTSCSMSNVPGRSSNSARGISGPFTCERGGTPSGPSTPATSGYSNVVSTNHR